MGKQDRSPSLTGTVIVVVALLIAAFLLIPGASFGAPAHKFSGSFGPDCSSGSTFQLPGAVAIADSSHEVYVADLEAGTVSRCTEGGSPADFTAGPGSGSNQIGGFGFAVRESCSEIAVNQSTGRFYVADLFGGAVKAYEANGEPAVFSAGPGAGTNELTGLGEVCGVAVDSTGNIYVSSFTNAEVAILESSGASLTSFSASEPANLGVASSGAVYVASYAPSAGSVRKFTPNQFPLAPGTAYGPPTTLYATPPAAWSVAVDPGTDDVYVDAQIDGERSRINQYDTAGVPINVFGETGPNPPSSCAGGLFQCYSEGVAVDGANGTVYVSNPGQGHHQVDVYVAAPPVPPTVVSTSVRNVSTTSADLEAEVSPELFSTHFHFEYLTEAAFLEVGESFAGAARTPETPLGSAETPLVARGHASGLSPEVAYRVRVVAENENGSAVSTPPIRFVTASVSTPGLPDGRVYELVSPAQKIGEVFAPEASNILSGSCVACLPGANEKVMAMQARPDGDAVAYVGQPFAAGLAGGQNQYVGSRGGFGWSTEYLSSPAFETPREGGLGYQAFSQDLSRAVIGQVTPTLDQSAPSSGGMGFWDLYLRASDGSLRPLIEVAPPNRSAGFASNHFQVSYRGANSGSADAPALTHILFEANDALAASVPMAPPVGPEEFNVYEWANGDLRLVNVLPDGTPAHGVAGSGDLFGQGTASDHAISNDGSRIFWSDLATGQAYVRVGGVATQKIEDGGAFITASADGSRVLLGDGCLYSLSAESCTDLTLDRSGIHQGGFAGLVGAAEGLSRIYFVGTTVLSGNEANEQGEHAEPGADNLYLWNEGETVFIAKLLGGLAGDNDYGPAYGDWKATGSARTAQVTPDGGYLAFMSRASLTGYDNRRSGGGNCFNEGPNCSEVFEYSANAAVLRCASCNPTGQRPLGRSTLSLLKWSKNEAPFRQPLNLGPDGRLFFESGDQILTRDVNGRVQDIYEWEPAGTRTGEVVSCPVGRANGCLGLISSGEDPNDSMFLDATPSGDDVFFVTRRRLVSQDRDDLLDLYDGRTAHTPGEPTGFPDVEPARCEGETCKRAMATPPAEQVAGTLGVAPGNAKVRHVKHKKKHKKHHKRSKKGHKHKTQGGSKQREGRAHHNDGGRR